MDVNKHGNENPKYRSRVVANYFRRGGAGPDLYTAAPPWEALRTRVHLAATRRGQQKKKMPIAVVSRAHFNADCLEPVYIGLPKDDPLEKGLCGKLNKAMYGTKTAALCWQRCYTPKMVDNGFVVARVNACCLFCHPQKEYN